MKGDREEHPAIDEPQHHGVDDGKPKRKPAPTKFARDSQIKKETTQVDSVGQIQTDEKREDSPTKKEDTSSPIRRSLPIKKEPVPPIQPKIEFSTVLQRLKLKRKAAATADPKAAAGIVQIGGPTKAF